MASKADRVVLVNAWHDRNTGDSAISHGCVKLARDAWPEAEIAVHTLLSTRDPAFRDWNVHLERDPDIESFHPSPFPEPRSTGRFRRLSVLACALSALVFDRARFLSWRYWAFRRDLKGARALVLIGGSDVFDISSSPTSRMRLIRVLAPAIVAKSIGVPVFFWGHTLGPFETAAGRVIASNGLSAARGVFVREEASAVLARELAPATDVIVAPDIAFLLEASAEQKAGSRYLVLVPRRHIMPGAEKRTENLVVELSRFAQHLIDTDEVDEVFLVAQVTGPSANEDDRTICTELAAKIDRKEVRVYTGVVDPESLVSFYGGAQAVVSVRLHGAILAIAAGVPAFAISYFTGKTEGVMNSVGAGTSWSEFDDVSSNLLYSWWSSTRLGLDGDVVAERISQMRAEVRNIAMESRKRANVAN